jgi:signal transduction histidine kinase
LKHNFFSGLSGKTAIIFLLAFISVALPVNWIVYKKVQATLAAADTEQLRAETDKLASLTKLDPVIVPLPASGYSLNVSQFHEGIIEPIFISPDFPPVELHWLQDETLEIDTFKVYQKRLAQPNGSQLWFTLSRSNRTLNNQLSEVKAYLFYLTGGAFCFMLILVFIISGFMFRPLKQLVESANQVHASEKMQRLPVPTSQDETHQLALALNEMIGRIESTINYQIKFFDSATHELKTPLSIMRAELSKAQANSSKDINTQQWISGLQDETERLERSIADFLLLSQLKNQTISLRKQSMHLPEIIFDVIQKLKRMAEDRRLTFSIQQADNSWPVMIDSDKVHTVIFNLVENAIRYSPEGSNITIIHKIFETNTILSISNSISAPINKIESLGDDRYADSQRGMGLGLWISKQLMALHDGSLQFTCTNNVFVAELNFKS